jgi:hypothetical protein
MKTIIIALCMLTAACGNREQVSAATSATTASTSAPSAAAAAPVTSADPCALVTAQDMGVMFGELKEGPSPSTGLRDERQCNYTNMAGSWIKLSLYGGRERWDWEKGITNAQSPKDVGGLGDEAFAIKRGTDAVVYVRKAESILELSCSCPSEMAEAIARVATKNL